MAWNNDKPTYMQLSSVKVNGSKNLVISSCSKGGFTLAQQLVSVDEDTGHTQAVFLKGACHIRDIDALKELGEAVETAIKHAEKIEEAKKIEDSIDWD